MFPFLTLRSVGSGVVVTCPNKEREQSPPSITFGSHGALIQCLVFPAALCRRKRREVRLPR